MVEISRGDLTEFPRNAAGDILAIRNLSFLRQTSGSTASGQADAVLKNNINPDKIGKKIEIKHPTDLSLFEVKTINNISGATITVDTNFANTYPTDSFVFLIESEKDILDSAVSDRVEANVQFIEQEFKEAD